LITALLTAVAALTAAIWAWLLFRRGGFWQVWSLLPPATNFSTERNRVIAVVPARNEAEFIGASIQSLLANKIQVVLVDDHSEDSTIEIAREAAIAAGKPDSLTIISSEPLPAGWSGKLWALDQGVRHALQYSPEFLLFSDADVVHKPWAVNSLLTVAGGGYDLVSFMVTLECRSLPERLLIPAFVFFFFLLYPPAWIRDPRRATAGAAGGCMLIRPAALERAGGLKAIRSRIIDDCALAATVKRSGGRVWLGLTESSSSTRPYRGFISIGSMISRTAFHQLHHSSWLLLATLVGLAVTYLAPPALLFSAATVPAVVGAVAWGAMAVSYLPMIRFYRLRTGWALTLPLAAVFYAAATVCSAVLYWSGHGGQWKGRVQDAPAAED
jgi:hopene-associated glycosyltransferase HpnB